MSANNEISEKRLLFLTALVSLLLILGSFYFSNNWRLTTGVFLGSALSFLNVYWLKTSITNLFKNVTEGEPPRLNTALYVLRYIIIAMIVAFAAALKLVSVAATLVGLLSFAFAILLEAIIQFYFIIVNREEN